MIIELERTVDEYDLILIIDDSDAIKSKIIEERLRKSVAFKDSKKKVMILTSNECKEMLSVFYTYEFSDKVKVISRNKQFGGLFNLVEADLMTDEEMFQAIMF